MRKNKFNRKTVEIDGIKFDSTKEGNYYLELKSRWVAGDIVAFRIKPQWVFILNGVKISSYTADFEITHKGGRKEVVDVKGMKTVFDKRKKCMVQKPVTATEPYRLRKKMMRAFYGIDVVEV